LDLIIKCNRRTKLRETTALGTRYDAKVLEYPLQIYSLDYIESIVLRWHQNHSIYPTSVFLKTDAHEVEGRPPHRGGEYKNDNDKETLYLRIVKRTEPRDNTFDVPCKDDAKLPDALIQRNQYLSKLEETALESGLVQIGRDKRDMIERIITANEELDCTIQIHTVIFQKKSDIIEVRPLHQE
jgi:hypothetical protein